MERFTKHLSKKKIFGLVVGIKLALIGMVIISQYAVVSCGCAVLVDQQSYTGKFATALPKFINYKGEVLLVSTVFATSDMKYYVINTDELNY